MFAAIKTLEDMLFIRRLQARELEHEGVAADPERLTILNRDVASLERGLRLLEATRGQRSAVSGQQENGKAP